MLSGLYCAELLRHQTQWTLTIKGMCQTNECKNFSFNFKEYIEMNKKHILLKMSDIIEKKKELSICLIKEWNEQGTMRAPSSSKPYQVLELRPVWGGITENDRLVHFLSYCHGNNSCDQSALARADSGRRSPPGMLLRVNVGNRPR